jgi:hypothetical protein
MIMALDDTNMFSNQCFCITDVTAVISSDSPFPFIDVRFNAFFVQPATPASTMHELTINLVIPVSHGQ